MIKIYRKLQFFINFYKTYFYSTVKSRKCLLHFKKSYKSNDSKVQWKNLSYQKSFLFLIIVSSVQNSE